MNLRKIIREEISRIFHEDTTITTGVDSALGGTLTDIGTALTTDYNNMDKIIKTQTIDTKNKDNEIKANLLLKGKLDQNSPHRKGLEREIPELQKDLSARQKQLKDLQNTQKSIKDAQAELEKQQKDLQTQSNSTSTTTATAGSTTTTQSVLPSLPSAI